MQGLSLSSLPGGWRRCQNSLAYVLGFRFLGGGVVIIARLFQGLYELKVGVDQLRRLIRCNSVAASGLSFAESRVSLRVQGPK